MGPGGWHRLLPGMRVMGPQGSLFRLDAPSPPVPPSPLPPSLFPRVGRGGEKGWPAGNGKNQDASFPQWGPMP